MQEITPELVRTFSALSDPVRMATLARLAEGSATVGELAEPFALSAAGFSKHLSVLQSAGLVDKQLDGRKHICSLNVEPLRAAFDWLSFYRHFWSDNLDRLDTFLGQISAKDTGKNTGK